MKMPNPTSDFIEDKEPADLIYIRIVTQRSYTELVHANTKKVDPTAFPTQL